MAKKYVYEELNYTLRLESLSGTHSGESLNEAVA